MPVLNIKLELDADNFKVNSSQIEGITGKLDASFASATAKATSFAFAFNNIFEIAGRLTNMLAAPVQRLIEVDEAASAAAEAFQTKLDGAIINLAKDLRPLIIGAIDFASALLDVNWTPFVVGAGAAGTALIAMNLSGIIAGLGAMVPALGTATTAVITFGGTVSVATGGITLLVGALAGLAAWIITSIDNEDDLAKKRKESAEETIALIQAEKNRVEQAQITNGVTEESTAKLKMMNNELVRQQIIIADSNITLLKTQLQEAKKEFEGLARVANDVQVNQLGNAFQNQSTVSKLLRDLTAQHGDDVVKIQDATTSALLEVIRKQSDESLQLSVQERKRLDDENKAYKEILAVVSAAAQAQADYNSEIENRKRLLEGGGSAAATIEVAPSIAAGGASSGIAAAAAAVQANLPSVRMDVAIAQNREALSLFVADSEKVFDDADEILRLRFKNNLISEQEYFDERMNLLGEFHRAQVGMWGEESAQALAVNAERLQMEQQFVQRKMQLHSQAVAATLAQGAQLANSAQGVNETLFGIGKGFAWAQALADTYAAANKAMAAYPPPFSFIAASAAITAGLLNVAKIDSVKFQRRQMGGIIGDSGIAGDFGGGENRLLIANDGEFVVNAEQTRRNRALLELLNAGAIGRGSNVQETGAVSGGLQFDPVAMGRAIGENVRIELRAELDAMKFYRNTFNEFQRREAERTV